MKERKAEIENNIVKLSKQKRKRESVNNDETNGNIDKLLHVRGVEETAQRTQKGVLRKRQKKIAIQRGNPERKARRLDRTMQGEERMPGKQEAVELHSRKTKKKREEVIVLTGIKSLAQVASHFTDVRGKIYLFRSVAFFRYVCTAFSSLPRHAEIWRRGSFCRTSPFPKSLRSFITLVCVAWACGPSR